MEGTSGNSEHFQFHMNFDAVFRVKERLLKAGALCLESRFIMTHFSHNIGCTHFEIEEIARPHGVEVAYDGMEIVL